MPDYKEMYFTLFRAITDALEALSQLNVGQASNILTQAQQSGEETYINNGQS